MTRPNVPNWQIFSQEDKRAHVNWRLKVTLQWLATFNLQLCIWQTLLSKVTYIEGILLIQFYEGNFTS